MDIHCAKCGRPAKTKVHPIEAVKGDFEHMCLSCKARVAHILDAIEGKSVHPDPVKPVVEEKDKNLPAVKGFEPEFPDEGPAASRGPRDPRDPRDPRGLSDMGEVSKKPSRKD